MRGRNKCGSRLTTLLDAAIPLCRTPEERLFLQQTILDQVVARSPVPVSIEQFMPSYKFSNPIDLEFSPSGDLYMLEYGTAWFQGNPDARLSRIEYNPGNRAPAAHRSATTRRAA